MMGTNNNNGVGNNDHFSSMMDNEDPLMSMPMQFHFPNSSSNSSSNSNNNNNSNPLSFMMMDNSSNHSSSNSNNHNEKIDVTAINNRRRKAAVDDNNNTVFDSSFFAATNNATTTRTRETSMNAAHRSLAQAAALQLQPSLNSNNNNKKRSSPPPNLLARGSFVVGKAVSGSVQQQQQRRRQQQPPPPKKKQQQEMKSPLLHQSCRLFPTSLPVIESAIESEPDAVTKRAVPLRPGMKSCFLVGDTRVPYSLPLNILLHHEATLEVLEAMMKACGPEALLLKDGREDCTSLIIALRLYGHATREQEEDQEREAEEGGGRHNDDDDDDDDNDDEESDKKNAPFHILPELLNSNPKACESCDRRRNFPLHVATYVGSSFRLINILYQAYPQGLLETNFHGETPLDICIKNGKCSDSTTTFLHEKMDQLKSSKLRNNSNNDDDHEGRGNL